MNAAEVPVLRKKLRRKEMVTFFQKLAPTVIAIRLAYCLISVPAGASASLAARHQGSFMSRACTHTTAPT